MYFEHNKPENTPASRYCAVFVAKHFWHLSLDTKCTNMHSEFLVFLQSPTCLALPENLKLAFGLLLLGLMNCWHCLNSVFFLLNKLFGDYWRQAKGPCADFMCVYVTFLLGSMRYELSCFICRLSFLYHDARHIILHVFSVNAQGHHVRKSFCILLTF